MMSQWHFLVTSTDTNHNIDLKVRRRSHLPWGSRVSMFCHTQLFLSTLLLPCYWPTYHVLNISTHKFDLKMRKYLHKFSMVCSLLIPACVCHFPPYSLKKLSTKRNDSNADDNNNDIFMIRQFVFRYDCCFCPAPTMMSYSICSCDSRWCCSKFLGEICAQWHLRTAVSL